MKDLERIISSIAAWCDKHPVRLGVLFGSQATGQARPTSDIDLAIWPSELLPTATKLRWITELELLLDKEVNLVLVSADLDPVLGMEIVRHGRLIFEREPELWGHHRLQLWHAYNDSLPFLRAARRRLREFAEEVRRGA